MSVRGAAILDKERFGFESVRLIIDATAALLLSGSMSRPVRNEVSSRSAFVDVTERKMSNSFCWFDRAVPFKSRTFKADDRPISREADFDA